MQYFNYFLHFINKKNIFFILIGIHFGTVTGGIFYTDISPLKNVKSIYTQVPSEVSADNPNSYSSFHNLKITKTLDESRTDLKSILSLCFFRKDSDKIISSNAFGEILVHSINDSRIVQFFRNVDGCTSLSVNMTDSILLVSGSTDTVSLFDIETQNSILKFSSIHNSSINISRFCNLNPNLFLTCSHDKTIKAWDIRSSSCIKGKPLYTSYCKNKIISINLSPDDSYVLSSGINEVNQFFISDGQLHSSLNLDHEYSDYNFTRSYYSASGKYIYTGCCEDSCLKIFSSSSTELISSIDLYPNKYEDSLYIQTLRPNPTKDSEIAILASYLNSTKKEVFFCNLEDHIKDNICTEEENQRVDFKTDKKEENSTSNENNSLVSKFSNRLKFFFLNELPFVSKFHLNKYSDLRYSLINYSISMPIPNNYSSIASFPAIPYENELVLIGHSSPFEFKVISSFSLNNSDYFDKMLSILIFQSNSIISKFFNPNIVYVHSFIIKARLEYLYNLFLKDSIEINLTLDNETSSSSSPSLLLLLNDLIPSNSWYLIHILLDYSYSGIDCLSPIYFKVLALVKIVYHSYLESVSVESSGYYTKALTDAFDIFASSGDFYTDFFSLKSCKGKFMAQLSMFNTIWTLIPAFADMYSSILFEMYEIGEVLELSDLKDNLCTNISKALCPNNFDKIFNWISVKFISNNNINNIEETFKDTIEDTNSLNRLYSNILNLTATCYDVYYINGYSVEELLDLRCNDQIYLGLDDSVKLFLNLLRRRFNVKLYCQQYSEKFLDNFSNHTETIYLDSYNKSQLFLFESLKDFPSKISNFNFKQSPYEALEVRNISLFDYGSYLEVASFPNLVLGSTTNVVKISPKSGKLTNTLLSFAGTNSVDNQFGLEYLNAMDIERKISRRIQTLGHSAPTSNCVKNKVIQIPSFENDKEIVKFSIAYMSICNKATIDKSKFNYIPGSNLVRRLSEEQEILKTNSAKLNLCDDIVYSSFDLKRKMLHTLLKPSCNRSVIWGQLLSLPSLTPVFSSKYYYATPCKSFIDYGSFSTYEYFGISDEYFFEDEELSYITPSYYDTLPEGESLINNQFTFLDTEVKKSIFCYEFNYKALTWNCIKIMTEVRKDNNYLSRSSMINELSQLRTKIYYSVDMVMTTVTPYNCHYRCSLCLFDSSSHSQSYLENEFNLNYHLLRDSVCKECKGTCAPPSSPNEIALNTVLLGNQMMSQNLSHDNIYSLKTVIGKNKLRSKYIFRAIYLPTDLAMEPFRCPTITIIPSNPINFSTTRIVACALNSQFILHNQGEGYAWTYSISPYRNKERSNYSDLELEILQIDSNSSNFFSRNDILETKLNRFPSILCPCSIYLPSIDSVLFYSSIAIKSSYYLKIFHNSLTISNGQRFLKCEIYESNKPIGFKSSFTHTLITNNSKDTLYIVGGHNIDEVPSEVKVYTFFSENDTKNKIRLELDYPIYLKFYSSLNGTLNYPLNSKIFKDLLNLTNHSYDLTNKKALIFEPSILITNSEDEENSPKIFITILALFSSFFKTFISGPFQISNKIYVEHETSLIKKIISNLYSGSLNIIQTKQNDQIFTDILNLIDLSSFYLLNSLTTLCESSLCWSVMKDPLFFVPEDPNLPITESLIFILFEISDSYSLKNLKKLLFSKLLSIQPLIPLLFKEELVSQYLDKDWKAKSKFGFSKDSNPHQLNDHNDRMNVAFSDIFENNGRNRHGISDFEDNDDDDFDNYNNNTHINDIDFDNNEIDYDNDTDSNSDSDSYSDYSNGFSSDESFSFFESEARPSIIKNKFFSHYTIFQIESIFKVFLELNHSIKRQFYEFSLYHDHIYSFNIPPFFSKEKSD